MVNRISAKIIADSKNEYGDRITTYVLVFPRIVLAEFNTHRALSKNSASSRAIPFKTMVQKVMDEPFVPIAFQREHKGMQGTDYITDPIELESCEDLWLKARTEAVAWAKRLHGDSAWFGDTPDPYAPLDLNVTKQLCNRLLEPFLYHTVICTGTEWENFFALRAHPAAEIHIADLAEKMLVAYNESTPKQLKAGEWHIPFGDKFDEPRLIELITGNSAIPVRRIELEATKVQVATARCARISYDNFDGKDDYVADTRLFGTLLKSGHMSPFEHCARAMSEEELDTYTLDVPRNQVNPNRLVDRTYGVCGNFKGFVQYRKTLPNENQSDTRVLIK